MTLPAFLPRARCWLLALLCPLAAACQDADTDPMAVVVTDETRSTLGLRTDLPALPELVARAGLDTDAATDASEQWTGSWNVLAGGGEAMRDRAYEAVVPGLAETLRDEGALGTLADVGEAVRAAVSLDHDSLTPAMARSVAEARTLHQAGLAAYDRGDLEAAFRHALEAADELREIGPSAMARSLIRQASEVLEARRAAREGPLLPGDDEGLRRAIRLVEGARNALDAGDWSRAVRRAYYACQILGVSPN